MNCSSTAIQSSTHLKRTLSVRLKSVGNWQQKNGGWEEGRWQIGRRTKYGKIYPTHRLIDIHARKIGFSIMWRRHSCTHLTTSSSVWHATVVMSSKAIHLSNTHREENGRTSILGSSISSLNKLDANSKSEKYLCCLRLVFGFLDDDKS